MDLENSTLIKKKKKKNEEWLGWVKSCLLSIKTSQVIHGKNFILACYSCPLNMEDLNNTILC